MDEMERKWKKRREWGEETYEDTWDRVQTIERFHCNTNTWLLQIHLLHTQQNIHILPLNLLDIPSGHPMHCAFHVQYLVVLHTLLK